MTARFLQAREARVLRLRLELGLAELEEIEHWADFTLLAMTNAPYELVELTMARSMGAKEAAQHLGVLGGAAIEPVDVILAAASADPQAMDPRQWERLLGRIAMRSSSFDDLRTPELDLILGAYGPSDELTHALSGNEVSVESAMVIARAWLSRVVEMAKNFREQAGGSA